jgi:hypothetical protein
MEINFNSGKIPSAESGQPVVKRTTAPGLSTTVSFPTVDALKSQLDSLPTSRADAVAKAKELVADSAYPPDYLLDRIANLLAIHLQNDTTNPSESAS